MFQFKFFYFYINVFHQLGSNILGIYPDILHVLDLAIYCDLIASSFLEWTDRVREPFEGRSRDERLLKLYARYLEWCQENRSPVLLAKCSINFLPTSRIVYKPSMEPWGPLFVLFWFMKPSQGYRMAAEPDQFCFRLNPSKRKLLPIQHLAKKNSVGQLPA